jgi:sugar lactone lactonase YvrE
VAFGHRGINALQDGGVIVSDKLSYQIKRFDRRGKLIWPFGKRGSGNGEFKGPGPIDHFKGTIAVSDFSSHRVQLFSEDMKFISSFMAAGPVFDLHFDAQGNIWVGAYTGKKNSGLFKYGRNGKMVSSAPLRYTSGDFFDDLFSFAIQPSGKIVVAYMVQNKIEIWDTSAKFEKQFQVSGFPPRPNYKSLSNGMRVPDGNIFRKTAVDRRGNIFLLTEQFTDNPLRDVQVLDPEGKYVTTFTLPAKAHLIFVDGSNNLFTIESKRTLVRKYKILSKKL